MQTPCSWQDKKQQVRHEATVMPRRRSATKAITGTGNKSATSTHGRDLSYTGGVGFTAWSPIKCCEACLHAKLKRASTRHCLAGWTMTDATKRPTWNESCATTSHGCRQGPGLARYMHLGATARCAKLQHNPFVLHCPCFIMCNKISYSTISKPPAAAAAAAADAAAASATAAADPRSSVLACTFRLHLSKV